MRTLVKQLRFQGHNVNAPPKGLHMDAFVVGAR